MTGDPTSITASLGALRGRWGSDIVRLGASLPTGSRALASVGTLALAPEVSSEPAPGVLPVGPAPILSSGFPALDALLGGLPRQGTMALVGHASSGITTLAQRMVAEAQVAGAIVAWLDLPDRFDPLEGASRGIDLRWLVVVRPTSPADGLIIGGSLVAGRSVDLLVVDLPSRLAVRHVETLRRIAAQARRVSARVLVLGATSLAGGIRDALGEVSQLRLGLSHREWLRVGREVVGQRVRVHVEKDRAGAPGRAVELEIRYPVDGDRGPALGRLLAVGTGPPGLSAVPVDPPIPPPRVLTTLSTPPSGIVHRPTHATAASPLGPSAAPPGAPSGSVATRPRRAGRASVGSGRRP